MDADHKRILTGSILELQASMILDDTLKERLVGKGVISREEMDDVIQANSTNDDRILALVLVLMRKPTDQGFGQFMLCLKDSNNQYTAELLEKKRENVKGNRSCEPEPETKMYIDREYEELSQAKKEKLYHEVVLKTKYLQLKQELHDSDQMWITNTHNNLPESQRKDGVALRQQTKALTKLSEEFEETVQRLKEPTPEMFRRQIRERDREIKHMKQRIKTRDNSIGTLLGVSGMIEELSSEITVEETANKMKLKTREMDAFIRNFEEHVKVNEKTMRSLSVKLDKIKKDKQLPLDASYDTVYNTILYETDLFNDFQQMTERMTDLELENEELAQHAGILEDIAKETRRVIVELETYTGYMAKFRSEFTALKIKVDRLAHELAEEKRKNSVVEFKDVDTVRISRGHFSSSAKPNERKNSTATTASPTDAFGYCLVCRKEIYPDKYIKCVYHWQGLHGRVWTCCDASKSTEGCRNRDSHLFDTQMRKVPNAKNLK